MGMDNPVLIVSNHILHHISISVLYWGS